MDISNIAKYLKEFSYLSFPSLHLFVLFGVYTATFTFLPFSFPFYIQIKGSSLCLPIESCKEQLSAVSLHIFSAPCISFFSPVISLKAFQVRASASVMSPQIPVVFWALNK